MWSSYVAYIGKEGRKHSSSLSWFGLPGSVTGEYSAAMKAANKRVIVQMHQSGCGCWCSVAHKSNIWYQYNHSTLLNNRIQ